MKKVQTNKGLKNEKQITLEYITDILSDAINTHSFSPVEPVNKDIFFYLIRHHKLNSIFYKVVSEKNIKIQDNLTKQLEVINKHNKIRMLKLSSELIKLNQILNQHNINYISLKGPALSQQLYNDYSIRSSKDLDILISEKDINIVYQALIKHGYAPRSKNSFLKRLSNKDIIFLSPNNIIIEIHYRLFNNKYLLPLPSETLKVPDYININNNPIPILPKHLNYLYQVCHAASHNWSRMVWTIDILLYKSLLSKEELEKSYTYASLIGTRKVFDQAINTNLNGFNTISNEKHYSLFKKFIFLLSLNSNPQYKKHEVLQRLLIPYRFCTKHLIITK